MYATFCPQYTERKKPERTRKGFTLPEFIFYQNFYYPFAKVLRAREGKLRIFGSITVFIKLRCKKGFAFQEILQITTFDLLTYC